MHQSNLFHAIFRLTLVTNDLESHMVFATVRKYLNKCCKCSDEHWAVLIRSVDLINVRIDVIVLQKIATSCTKQVECILDYGCCFFITSYLGQLGLVLLEQSNLLGQWECMLFTKFKVKSKYRRRADLLRLILLPRAKVNILTFKRAAFSS